MNKTTIAAAFGGLAVVGLIGGCTEAVNRSFYPPEVGADYLKSQGHQNITGGERDYFNMCGKNVFAREYQTIQAGKSGSVTVCFTPFWGPHRPLLDI